MISNQYLSDLTIIVRSTGERTTTLCRTLITEDTGIDDIQIVGKIPFYVTLAECLEIGLKRDKEWTLCVDADVLPFPGAITELLYKATTLDNHYFEIQGLVFDKFFGGWRPAGVHLYRTAFIPKALPLISEFAHEMRPETCMLNAMMKSGYDWAQTSLCFGLHDFDRHANDIFRKAFIHSWKHKDLLIPLIDYWRSRAKESDFFTALKGLSAGISHTDDYLLDKSAQCYTYNEKDDTEAIENTSPLELLATELQTIRTLGYDRAPVWDWAESFWHRKDRNHLLHQIVKKLKSFEYEKYALENKNLCLLQPLQQTAKHFGLNFTGLHFHNTLEKSPTVHITEDGKLTLIIDKSHHKYRVDVPRKGKSVDNLRDTLSKEFMLSLPDNVIVYGAGDIASEFHYKSSVYNIHVNTYMKSEPSHNEIGPDGNKLATPEEAIGLYPESDIVIASIAFKNQMLHRLLACPITSHQKIWVL